MDHEQFDTALDAAAKELMTDAPEELLQGVMYRIEKDAKPKKRFAFGRFTGFAAVAAAVLIFIAIRSGSVEKSFDMDTGSAGASAPEAANYDIAGAETMTDAGVGAAPAGGADMAEFYSLERAVSDEAVKSAVFGIPPELSHFESMLYDYLDSFDEELISVEIVSITDNDLTAVAVLETQIIEVLVTRDGASSGILETREATPAP